MSKAISLLVSLVTLSGLAASVGPAVAADRPLPPPVVQAPVSSNCGPCGCLQVGYDHHRVLNRHTERLSIRATMTRRSRTIIGGVSALIRVTSLTAFPSVSPVGVIAFEHAGSATPLHSRIT
jgi:hypothetical protein